MTQLIISDFFSISERENSCFAHLRNHFHNTTRTNIIELQEKQRLLFSSLVNKLAVESLIIKRKFSSRRVYVTQEFYRYVLDWYSIVKRTSGEVFNWKDGDRYIIPEHLLNDRKFILHGLKYSSIPLLKRPSFNNDRELVMESVKYRDTGLRYASKELRNDPIIILHALDHVPSTKTLRCVSSATIIQNEQVLHKVLSRCCKINDFENMTLIEKLLKLVRKDFFFIVKFQELLKDHVRFLIYNQEFILQFLEDNEVIVKSWPCNYIDLIEENFPKAEDGIKTLSRELDKKLVETRGMLLRYSAEEYKDDEEIVRGAMLQYPRSVRYASERLRLKLESK